MGLLLVVLALPGCSRMFWRSQADFDTYNQLLEKTTDQRWDLPRITVEADPRSRFFDVTNPDCPPLPPDDPAASLYMQAVDGMPGYKSWHKFGQDMTVENPQWLSQFEFAPALEQAVWERTLSETGEPVVRDAVPTIRNLTLEQAIELSNLHSREYQTAIEGAYLSSLLLTFDRFQFNVRYLGIGGGEPTSSLNYLNTPSVRDDLQFNNRFGVRQALPTGGQWALELANNTLWLFSGDNRTSSSSILSYSITQPLLLGAGRKVVLENLTLSEREVLYDVRTLARFRKIFFSDVVVNGNGGGFLGLLRQQQQVNNQRGNIQALAVQIERLREINALPQPEGLEDFPAELKGPNGELLLPEDLADRLRHDDIRKRITWRGPMSPEDRDRLKALSEQAAWDQAIENLFSRTQSGVVTLDLAQLLTRLSQQENSLRDAERQLLDSIDSYKLELGLPTDFQLTLDTSLLEQFQLIDPRINELENAILAFKRELGTIDEYNPSVDELIAATAGVEELRQLVRTEGLDLIESDFRRVDAILPERLTKVTDEFDRDIIIKDLERSRVVYRDVVLDQFSKSTELLRAVEADLARPELSAEERTQIFVAIDSIREDLLQLTQSLRAVQAGLRSELITIQDFDMTQDEVVRLAIENRLDLMNARAQVMDARRAMEVAANRLEAVLNVVAAGDIGTSGGTKPFDFRGDRSTFRAGVQFTAPLDQVLERNAYRQSQVTYQRARRAYMDLEDRVKLDVRTQWRTLKVLKENIETARQNLRIAAVQLDSSVENFNAPVRPGQQSSSGSGNLGLNLLNALQSVLNAQNELIRIWVQFEQNRINIHRDMDIMQVDERGLWIDPVYQNLSTFGRVAPPPNEPADVPPPATADRIDARPFDDVVVAPPYFRYEARHLAGDVAESDAVDSSRLARWRRDRALPDAVDVAPVRPAAAWTSDGDDPVPEVPPAFP
jgi:outer membrane protein TolC